MGRDKLAESLRYPVHGPGRLVENGNIEASLLNALSREDLQKIKKSCRTPG